MTKISEFPFLLTFVTHFFTMGCLKLSYFHSVELKIISSKKVLTSKKSENNMQATISDLKFHFVKDYDTIREFHPTFRAAYDYYPFGMLMPDRYVSDTSMQCITVMQPKWLWRWVKVWCKDIYEWQWPIFKEINGGKAFVSSGAVSINLNKAEEGVSFDVPVEAGVQQQFTLNIVEEEISGEGASIQVMELQVDGWQPLAQFDLKRGEVIATFTPSVSTVKLLFTGPMAVKVSSWCLYKWEMVQQQVLVDICSDDKDPYRFGFNGMLKDNELKGVGNSLDFGARMYDSRIGRWFAKDPIASKYPFASPYNFSLNTPIWAKDPDGKVVLFFNGQHAGDGGKTDYWRSYKNEWFGGLKYTGGLQPISFIKPYQMKREIAVDKLFMNAFGDHAARYYDGAVGGWGNTLLKMTAKNNVHYENRIKAGEAMGYSQAADIYKNLEPGETIKIVTHSMGTAHSRGFVDGMNRWAKVNKKSFNFEFQVDLAAFDGQDLPASASVKKSFYKSGNKDYLANPKKSLGIGKTSDIDGAERIPTKEGTGHSISGYDAEGVKESEHNNSAKQGSKPVYEQNR